MWVAVRLWARYFDEKFQFWSFDGWSAQSGVYGPNVGDEFNARSDHGLKEVPEEEQWFNYSTELMKCDGVCFEFMKTARLIETPRTHFARICM